MSTGLNAPGVAFFVSTVVAGGGELRTAHEIRTQVKALATRADAGVHIGDSAVARTQ